MMTTTLIDILETFRSEIDESHILEVPKWRPVIKRIDSLCNLLREVLNQ